MKYYNIRSVLPKIITIYLGMMLAILPYFGIGGGGSEIILDNLGWLFIIFGVMWYFSDKINTKIDNVHQSTQNLKQYGLETIKILSTREIPDVLFYENRISPVFIVINFEEVNKGIIEVLNYLSDREISSHEIKLLLSWKLPSESKETIDYDSITSFEKKMLLDLIYRITKKNKNFSIKFIQSPFKYSTIFERDKVLILAPFDLKGKSLFHCTIDGHSEVGLQYRDFANELWRNSQDYNELIR